MTPVRKKRLLLVLLMLTGVAAATTLVLMAFNENVTFFFSVTEVRQGKAPVSRPFRMGGMVVKGSVKRETGSLGVTFDLTDNQSVVSVFYDGILPDLFREGQGIITRGQLDNTARFIASEVLAKHDEKYMPPEVADSMKPVLNADGSVKTELKP